MVLREEMYFEPRTISPAGNIRWFGEIYTAPQMLCHIEQTVYIRDNDTAISYRDGSGNQKATVDFMKNYEKSLNRFKKINLPKDLAK